MSRILQQVFLVALFAITASQASARFLQPDWLDPTVPGVGTNRYAYCNNDPINCTDPSGNTPFDDFLSFFRSDEKNQDVYDERLNNSQAALDSYIDEVNQGIHDNRPIEGVGRRLDELLGTRNGYARRAKSNSRLAIALDGGLVALEVGGSKAGGFFAGGGKLGGATDDVSNLAMAGKKGVVGEGLVNLLGEIGQKQVIKINGRNRIPDGVNQGQRILSEVKNVKHQANTQQLRDMLDWSKVNNYSIDLYTRSNTTFSGPLLDLINSGAINHRIIPGL